MEKRELTCIGCPMGCQLTVTLQDREVLEVTGNTCKRGAEYGRKECTHPTRIVTSTAQVSGGSIARVSVKTAQDIPKEKIMDCMKEIHGIRLKAPVYLGSVLLKNVADTGIDVIATKTVEKE